MRNIGSTKDSGCTRALEPTFSRALALSCPEQAVPRRCSSADRDHPQRPCHGSAGPCPASTPVARRAFAWRIAGRWSSYFTAQKQNKMAGEKQDNGGTTLNPAGEKDGNTDQGAPNNPPPQDDAVDGDVQARFMERAMAESARLRREAVRLCVTPAEAPAPAICAAVRRLPT
jgi:hypothetical protein